MMQSPSNPVRQASTWSIVSGALLIIFGILAIGSPFIAAIARDKVSKVHKKQ